MNIGLIVVVTLMLVFSAMIVYEDTKGMDVIMWQLLGLSATGILGTLIIRAVQGTFSWEFFIAVPIYVVIEVINSIFNKHAKYLGQADVDILAGVIALAVSLCLYINNTICECIADTAPIIIGSLVIELLFWLLFGILLDLIVVAIQRLVMKIKKNPVKTKLMKSKIPACLAFIPPFIAVVVEAITYIS